MQGITWSIPLGKEAGCFPESEFLGPAQGWLCRLPDSSHWVKFRLQRVSIPVGHMIHGSRFPGKEGSGQEGTALVIVST